MFPTKEAAEQLLNWASELNPGPWTDHCKVAARAAETIAARCGLDTDRAYVSGLLHDIGYYSYRDGKGEKDHIFAGYDLMMQKGYTDSARICLTHSFSLQDARHQGCPGCRHSQQKIRRGSRGFHHPPAGCRCK